MSSEFEVGREGADELAAAGVAGTARLWLGIGLVLLSTVIYGITPAAVSVSRGDLSVLDMIAYRSAVAALMFFTLNRLIQPREVGVNRPVRARGRHGIAIGALLWGPQVLVFYASFEHIDTSLAVAISFVYPTLVLVMGPVARGERPDPGDVALSVLALAGIAVLLLPGGAGDVDPGGVALVLLAAFGYACYVLLADRLLRGARPFELGAQISLGATLCAAAVGLTMQRLTVLDSPREWAVVGLQALLMVAATTCYDGGLRRLGSGQTSLIDTVQPVVALVAGNLLLGEGVGATRLLGVALVMASVAASSVVAHRRAVAARSLLR